MTRKCWSQQSTSQSSRWSSTGSDNGGQAWYDLALAVSPSEKTFVVGGEYMEVNKWWC